MFGDTKAKGKSPRLTTSLQQAKIAAVKEAKDLVKLYWSRSGNGRKLENAVNRMETVGIDVGTPIEAVYQSAKTVVKNYKNAVDALLRAQEGVSLWERETMIEKQKELSECGPQLEKMLPEIGETLKTVTDYLKEVGKKAMQKASKIRQAKKWATKPYESYGFPPNWCNHLIVLELVIDDYEDEEAEAERAEEPVAGQALALVG